MADFRIAVSLWRCYSWPGFKANPTEAARGKLVPPHVRLRWNFGLDGFDYRNLVTLNGF